jgi:general secretion pathway protein K
MATTSMATTTAIETIMPATAATAAPTGSAAGNRRRRLSARRVGATGAALARGREPASDDGGFALVVVVWMAGLAALLMLSFAAAARVHMRASANAVALAEARALADGGVSLALAELLRASPAEQTPKLLAAPRVCRLPAGGVLALSLTDEAGRVDLNVAGSELLTALLIGAGTTADAARRIADAVIDDRDADDERQAGGSERDAYRAARHPSMPRNTPFTSVAELGGVLGVTPALSARLAPYLTVRSGQEGIDSAAADPSLVAMLARGAAADSLAARLAGIGSAELLPEAFRVASARQAFAIRSAVTTATGTTFVREAVVAITAAGSTAPTSERRRATASDAVASVRARAPRRAADAAGAGMSAHVWEWRRIGPSASERRGGELGLRSVPLAAC